MCSLVPKSFVAKRDRSVLFLLLTMILAGVGCQSSSSSDELQPEANRRVYALGRLEPKEGIVSISGSPGEQLRQFDPDVRENEKAPADGILGLLSSYDMRRAQLAALETKKQLAIEKQEVEEQLADAQLKQAEASLAQARAQLGQAILQKRKLNNLKEAAEIARLDLVRLKGLKRADDELVTDHQIRRQENLTDRAIQDHAVAEASNVLACSVAESAVRAAEANRDVALLNKKKLGTKESPGVFNQARAIEEEIKIAELALVRSVLWVPHADTSILKRPQEGSEKAGPPENPCQQEGPPGEFTVLKIFLREGEFVSGTPVMQLGKLDEMVCKAEVYEADVKDIRQGQQVIIRSPAFANQFADDEDPVSGERTGGIRGTVDRIGGMISSPGLSHRNPLAPADRSIVEVTIRIDDAAPGAVQHAAERVNLQVTVEFVEKPASNKQESTARLPAGTAQDGASK